MKCCENKNNENQEQNHNHSHKGHMSHMLMMALCCGAPVILLLIIPLLGSRFSGLRGFLTTITPFICPLMMVMMIPMMFGRHNKNEDNKSERIDTAVVPENRQLK